MNRKRMGTILIVVGVLLAVAVGAIVYTQSEQAAEIARQLPTVDVVVATADLPERAAIAASAVAMAKVPAEVVPTEAATNVKDVVGKYPLTRIYKGEIIIRPKLADTSSRTSPSFTLKEGQVAISYPGNDLLTSAGAIRPGDRVDVLLTLPLARASTTSSGSQTSVPIPMVTQTLLQNVEVLRVGNFPATGQPEGAPSGKTITFNVDHQDALILKWAKDSGGIIDLVLRHPSEKEPVSTEAVTANYVLRKFRFTLAEPLQ